MEEITFSALAPRRGTRPLLSPWSDIGTSAMSGGAFNWGSLWSGVKSFGSSLKNLGVKTWNSSAAQALKTKLKESKVQDKIIEGINAGVHGALDIARQELEKKIASKLDQPLPVPDVEVEEPQVPDEIVPSAPPLPAKRPSEKRPIDEEEIVISTEEPPSYDSLFPDKSPPPPLVATPVPAPRKPIPPPRKTPVPPPRKLPTTRPHPSMVTPVLPPASEIMTLEEPAPRPLGPLRKPTVVSSRNNWQNTLNSIVGLGVRAVKRRRCY